MKNLSEYIIEAKINANGFCILKPGFINHKDEFEDILFDNSWDILQSGECKLTLKQAKELYMPHKDEDFYNDLCKYMSSDKCEWYICYKNCKNPIKDMDELKDEIRKKWGKDEMKNAMHSSDSIKNVNREKNIVSK